MSTSYDPAGSQQYVDFDEYVDYQLQRTREQIRWTDLLTALTGIAVAVLAYTLVFVLLDHWVIEGGFSVTSRIAMLTLLVTGTTVWLARKVLIPATRRVSSLFAARTIEHSAPDLKDSLLNLIDLKRSGRPLPESVGASLEKRAAMGLSQIDMEQTVDRSLLMRLALALLALVVVFCLYTLLSPRKISDSLIRALLPTAAVEVPTRTQIVEVSPGDETPVVLAGSHQEVRVRLLGEVPEQVVLTFSTKDRLVVDQPVVMRLTDGEIREYRGTIHGAHGDGIQQPLTYGITAGDDHAGPFAIDVTDPPVAMIDRVRLTWPEYMEREPLEQTEGHLDSWEGTQVELQATVDWNATGEGQRTRIAELVMTSRRDSTDAALLPVPLMIEGDRLTARWTMELPLDSAHPREVDRQVWEGWFFIRLRNSDGLENDNPTRYRLTVRPDRPPLIQLEWPTTDLERPLNAVLPLKVRARDPDFRLRNLRLMLRKVGDDTTHREVIFDALAAGTRPQSLNLTHELRLDQQRLQLAPGDELLYWIEARDNCETARRPDGNASASHPRLRIRITRAVEEQAAEQQEQQDRQQAEEAARQNNQDGPRERPEFPPEDEPAADRPAGDQPQADDPNENPNERAEKERPQADPEAGEQPEDQPRDNRRGDNQPDDGTGNGDTGQGEQAGSEKSGRGNTGEKSGEQRGKPRPGDMPGADGDKPQPGDKPEAGDKPGADGSEDGDMPRKNGTSGNGRGDSGQPADSSDSNRTESGGKPGEEQKPGDRQGTNSGQGANSGQSGNQPESGDNGLDPNDETGEALEKLIRAIKKKQQEEAEQGDGGDSPNPQPNDDGQQNSEDKGENSADGNDARKGDQSQDGSRPDAGNDGDSGGTPDAAGDKPDGDSGSQGKPGQPGDEKSEGDEPGGDRQGAGGSKSAGSGKPKPEDGDGMGGSGGTPDGKPKPDGDAGGQAQPNAKPGQGAGSRQKNGDKPANSTKTDGTGTEQPADSDGPAERQKARGDETGEGTPETDPDADPTKSTNPEGLQRKPGTEPARRPGEGDPMEGTPRKNGQPGEQRPGSGNPRQADRKPGDPENRNPDEPSGEGDKTDGSRPAPRRPESQPAEGNEPLRGKGRPDGQKSKQPAGGESGGSKQDDAGSRGGDQPGRGETTPREGGGTQSDGQQGGQPDSSRPGQRTGEGRQNAKPGGNQESQQDGQPGNGQSGGKPGQPGGKPGPGQGNSSGAGERPGQNDPQGTGGTGEGRGDAQGTPNGGGATRGGASSRQNGSGTGDGPGGHTGEQADLEHNRKAANLVLKELEQQLERGEVDQNLLDELGWNKQQLGRFTRQLKQRLESRENAAAPADRLRSRKFEEMLRTLDLRSAPADRRGSEARRRVARETAGPGRLRVPAEYRRAFEAYTRSLAEDRAPAKQP